MVFSPHTIHPFFRMSFLNKRVAVYCPTCSTRYEATLEQIADEATLACTCGKRIKLEDHNGMTRERLDRLDALLNNVGQRVEH
jgi:hypothetical protein